MKTILITPKNDEESLMIIKIAKKFKIPILISDQPHGARLEKEKNLVKKLKKINPTAENLVIVEIPGIEKENELKKQGFKIIIIDHHRYEGLDRMQSKSSLEQFLEYFKITNESLSNKGFDPEMIDAVAGMDRGFVWELYKMGLSKDKVKKALDFYRQLTLEIGGERRKKEEEEAREAWKNRENKNGVILIKSEKDNLSIRDAVSFLVAEEYTEPQTLLIVQGKKRMYVQESKNAKDLYDKFGGFTFGQDHCWGIMGDEKALPDIDDVLSIVVK